MKTKLETISPAVAADILKTCNQRNRPVRDKAVHDYAVEMRAGRWGVTHQGIALDDKNVLVDGQHRLLAVIESGQTVQMLVTRGIPARINQNGVFTMDVIDSGRRRTTADQLNLLHGLAGANLVVGALRTIGAICSPLAAKSVTVGQAKGILSIYQKEIEECVSTIGNFKPMRRAAVIGALAFCQKVEAEKVREFVQSAASGEGLKKGSAALALREHLTNHTRTGSRGNLATVQWVGNALHNYVHGWGLTNIRRGATGIDFFRSRQRASVEKVRAIFGAD